MCTKVIAFVVQKYQDILLKADTTYTQMVIYKCGVKSSPVLLGGNFGERDYCPFLLKKQHPNILGNIQLPEAAEQVTCPCTNDKDK